MLNVYLKLERSYCTLKLYVAICIRFKACAYRKKKIGQNLSAGQKV